MQNVDEFIETLLNEKGITEVEPEIREDLKLEMKTTLVGQINRAAINELNEEQAAELEEKTKDPSFNSEVLKEFLENAGVNLDEITKNTMETFRNLYLEEGE